MKKDKFAIWLLGMAITVIGMRVIGIRTVSDYVGIVIAIVGFSIAVESDF